MRPPARSRPVFLLVRIRRGLRLLVQHHRLVEILGDSPGDGGLYEADLNAGGDLQTNVVVPDGSDDSVRPADGDDLIPDLDALDQALVGLDAPFLRTDEHEVEDRYQKAQEDEALESLHGSFTSLDPLGVTRTEPLRRLFEAPILLPRQASDTGSRLEQLDRGAAGRRVGPHVSERRLRRHPAPGSPPQEAELHEIGLVDVLDRVWLLTHCHGERGQADGPPSEAVNQRIQYRPVDLVEPPLVALEHLQSDSRDVSVDGSVRPHLRIVPHPTQEPVADPGG